jgi:hypothetical protein
MVQPPLWRRVRAPLPETVGYAVRVDWPDGTHLIFGWRRTWKAVCRLLLRNHRYWRPGPTRPHTWSVVSTTRSTAKNRSGSSTCGRWLDSSRISHSTASISS